VATFYDCAAVQTHSTLDVKLGDLMDFFHERKMRDLDLKIRCPHSGVPLPFVEISEASTLGLSGKLEFSLRLSEAVLQFMQARSSLLE
jgi:hypothetical protein